MDGSGAAVFDLGRSLFFYRSDYNVETLGAGCVENQEWELAVAGDEAEFLFGFEHCRNCVSLLNNARARRPHDCRRDAGATA